MRRPLLAALLFLLILGGCFLAPAQDSGNHPITVKALEARLEGLQKGRGQALADLNAYDGAIQECQYWLNLLKQAENPPPAPKAAAEKKPPADKPKPEPGAKAPVPKEKSDDVQ